MTSYIMPTYFNRLPIAFEYGKGSWVWDTDHHQYLDALSGIAVCGLGHAHPDITNAMIQQASKIIHTSNNYQIPNQEKLAEALCKISGMEQAYFCNSGAETNEAAIKLTRQYAKRKNISHPIIITMKHSFHGRTFATLCASGTERIQQGFEPLMPGFIYVDFNDFSALEKIAATHPEVVAVMLEPIQGDGGIQIAETDYLEKIRALCDQNDYLLIFDEVQTGMGRTGKWFAYQHSTIMPDILTVAKTLGNGFPIGSCLARAKALNLFGPGQHGSTFGGNPLGCAIGLEVIQTIQRNHILEHVERMGHYLTQQLKDKLSNYPEVKSIRGKGLMIGVELDRSCLEIPKLALKHKLLTNVTSNRVIRLLPPLIITQEEVDELVNRLEKTIQDFLAASK